MNAEITAAKRMPDESKQQRIASYLSAQVSGADTAERQALLGVVLLDRLERSTLARAFRGELVPQDPTDCFHEAAPAVEPVTTSRNRLGRRAAA